MENMYDILARLDKVDRQALNESQALGEKITRDMTAGEVISDFVASDDPRFQGKSREERKKMALGAYYGMHPEKSRREGVEEARNPQELDYQEGPEDDAEYRAHHGLDDPVRQDDRSRLATDAKTLNRLERNALARAAQVDEADLDEVSRGEYIRQQDAQAERQGKKSFQAFGQDFSTDEVKESLTLEAAAKKATTPWPGSAEYKEKFGQDRETFRKKHAPSVMKSPEARKELEKLDTEYEAGKKGYGRDEEGDDDEEGKKKAAPAGEKRGRGRPKGSKRAIGAKGPSGRSKLLTREQQLDEISSDLALTAARRAEKIGQAYADDNLSSGPAIGYEYMQQAKRLQRGAEKRQDKERDQEVQAALSPAKRRRMTKEEQLDEVSVGDRVTIDFPGSQAHGKSGEIVSIRDGMAKVAVGGATGTQTKMQWDSGAFGPRGMEVDLGRGQRGGGTHTEVPLDAVKRQGDQLDEISSDLALTAARRAEKIGQAHADDNLSSGPAIGYEYMQQAKRLQRGADKRRERERDQEVQAALSPAKRRRMQTEDYDRDEYDEEGEMAKSFLRTIEDAAEELQGILSDEENLPEWVQKKITLAYDYLDTARDYMKANPPEDQGEIMPEGSTGDYSAKKARAGKDIGRPGKNFAKIAKSAGERYGSEERGEKVAGAVLANLRAKEDVNEVDTGEADARKTVSSSKDQQDKVFARHRERVEKEFGNTNIPYQATVGQPREPIKDKHGKTVDQWKESVLKKYPDAKFMHDRGGAWAEALLPNGRKLRWGINPGSYKPIEKSHKQEKPVKETTTAGSVATAPAAGGKKSKGGVEFGKGIYEGQLEESFQARLQAELGDAQPLTESVNVTMTVSATDDEAMALSQLMKMAGLFRSEGYRSACGSCGQMHEGSCRMMEEDLANSADNTETMSTDYMVNDLAGGLNGPKQQVNPNNMADNPLAMKNLGSKGASGQLNLGAIAEDIEQATQQRLLDLYRKIS